MSMNQPTAATSTVAPRTVKVSTATSIKTFYLMVLRGQLTKGRLFGLVVLSGLCLLLCVVARGFEEEVAVDVLSGFGLALFIPLAALILATPMLGNMIEDRLLVYLWLKPVPRWHLAVAAYGAVVTVLLPIVVLPLAIGAAITGFGSLVLPTIGAAVLGLLAYSALYLFFGMRFSWGLWLGLLYLVLWENVLSTFSDGMAQLSIRSYLLTVFERGTDIELGLAGRSGWASIVVPLAVAAVAVALTARALSTQDID